MVDNCQVMALQRLPRQYFSLIYLAKRVSDYLETLQQGVLRLEPYISSSLNSLLDIPATQSDSSILQLYASRSINISGEVELLKWL